jgi:hypothetical protein
LVRNERDAAGVAIGAFRMITQAPTEHLPTKLAAARQKVDAHLAADITS